MHVDGHGTDGVLRTRLTGIEPGAILEARHLRDPVGAMTLPTPLRMRCGHAEALVA